MAQSNDNGTNGTAGGLEQSFSAALRAASSSPESEHSWDHLEELAEELQRPDDVASLYREVLERQLGDEVRTPLAERAVQFHDEWFGDSPETMTSLLSRIIEIDPEADWAFERLTVMLTGAEQWDELLAVYDRALTKASSPDKRRQLLDDAAQVAKDFADQSDRAADYMQQLVALDPTNAQLVTSLERLLEKQDRHRDLIELWQSRLAELPTAEARTTRLRIATYWLDQLGEPERALETLRIVLQDSPGQAEACALAERVLENDDAPAETRRAALSLLRKNYLVAERPEDVVRVLQRALEFIEPEERRPLHRECGNRLAILGRDTEAMDQYAELLQGDPTDTDARKQLRQLAVRSERHDLHAQALISAAEACEDESQRVAVLSDAAHLHRTVLDDTPTAIELYSSVLSSTDAEPAVAQAAAHALNELLTAGEQAEERLAVLEQLANLEQSSAVRRSVLAEAARLADTLGDPDRALANWAPVLEANEHDLEALSAVIDLLERNERWDALVDALRKRLSAPVLSSQRRADMVRVAQVQADKLSQPSAAIDTWLEVRAEFGENAETIAAIDELMSEEKRWQQLVDMLGATSERERGRIGTLLTRVADVYRMELNENSDATLWYARALGVDPNSEDARTGLDALLEDNCCVAQAADALADAYETTDDWQNLLGLLDHRLAATADDQLKARLLAEAAAVQLDRASEPAEALSSLARALPLDPANLSVQARLLALAETTDGWAEAVGSLQQAAAAAGAVPQRAAELRVLEGRIHEQRLHDVEAALDAYQEAHRLDPHQADTIEAVARCAATTGHWELAASAVVAAMRTLDRFDPPLMRVIEGQALGAEAYGKLARSLAAALQSLSARSEPPPAQDDEFPSLVDEDGDGARKAATSDAAGGLAAPIAQNLELAVARWLRDECSDLESAEQAALRAVAHDPNRLEALEMLAGLQRRSPGSPLVRTLVQVNERSPRSLDALHEAANVALDAGHDVAETLVILEELYRKAGRMWTSDEPMDGDRTASEVADWALDKLVARHVMAGNADLAVQTLRDAARLPHDPVLTGELRGRAAEMLADRGDRSQAIDLYRRVLEADPSDLSTLRRVAELSEQDGRISEALALRLRELELTDEPSERLRLRLENARLTGVLEERGGRVEALMANLQDAPGHEASLEALSQILDERGRHEDLAGVLKEQALSLEERGERTRAAELFARVAALAETPLGNVEMAIEAHTKVVEIEVQNASLDALARLHLERDEPAEAAKWLQKRLETASEKGRVAVLLQLARARIRAEKQDAAIKALQTAFTEAPRNTEVRKLLFRLYRSGKSWMALAEALTTASAHVSDESTVLAYAREAAEIYHDRLGTPEQAVPVLRKAVSLATDDRKLKTMLAGGLRLSGELDEARELLVELIEGFGRRRSTERAALHLELARVLHAQDATNEAIDELDKASKMDAGNVTILHTLAELARQSDQIDRAERAYRTLLLKVRRAPSEGEAEAPIGASEVLLELSRIAAARGQKDKADELLESAMESLTQHDTEAPVLQSKLREQGEFALLHRVLETRLTGKQPPRRRAEILAEKAEILDTALECPQDALDARLDAIKCDPASPVHHQAAWDLADRLSQLDRYVEQVEGMLAETPDSDAHVHFELLLRLGEVYEKARDDMDRAAEYYAQAEQTGVRQVDAWRAQARLAGARGDEQTQLELLNKLASLGEDQAETRASALYRMAEVQLASSETLAQGIDALRKALEDDTRVERAALILRRAAEAHPQDVELLDLYERVAREVDDQDLLLHYLERRTYHDSATPEHAREAASLATLLGHAERAHQLMVRAAAIGRAHADEDGMAKVDWALLGLASASLEDGDLAEAVSWLGEAAEVASLEEVFALGRSVAEMAAAPGGDLTLAAKLYERLLERHPEAREAWEPLADLYSKLGDIDGLERIVAEILDGLQEPADRNALRVLLAKALLAHADRADDAVNVLNDVLVENPVHAEAQSLLAAHLEQAGKTEELLDLLRRQFSIAQESGDPEAVKGAALRLGERLEEDAQEEALAVYHAALESGDDTDLLRAMLARLGEDHDEHERAALTERLLATEQGETAGALALALCEMYRSLDDDDGMLRSLKLGYERDPSNETLREGLEERYRERGDFQGLASTMVDAASRRDDADGKVALLREAARVYRDKLEDHGSASALLREACESLPDQVDLQIELATTLESARDHGAAVAVLGEALERMEAEPQRLELLLAKAELHAAADEEPDLLAALEGAFTIDAARVAPMFEGGLQNARVRAGERGDREAERHLTLRCVDVMMVQEKREDISLLLAEWIDRAPEDLEALRLRRDLDAEDGRWESVAETCERLVDLEQDAAQVDAALSLAHAYREMDAPERSLSGLERARKVQPDSPELRAEVKKLYEQTGAERELASLLLEEAASMEDADQRREVLLSAGQTLVRVGDAAGAVPALREALELKPNDGETVAALADAYTLAGWFDDADGLLDQAIEATKGRRTPELCMLLHRKSELARAQGDSTHQLELLQEAHMCNKKNGAVAAALADLAEDLQDWDLATKTLRTISLIDTECPISRGQAFLRQGRIAFRQGDTKNALMWARRAKREDPDSEEINLFMAEIS